ncbi:putative molybdopterin biosynthesis protein [Maridesulfovibrio ferrireducens]|uniref:Molybdopterin molybdenumtransferase n=1 Tax=Maridesulfovibrio ferrireducens TaxID=246191 RepID=A0A1G9G0B9_9BACT|nr:molybdopterin biosynthesis protein [Maridesulfovibrio ferrireducens]SDK94111.1 putative molybdopterin biosynthesis protein [Maridesulfovibrio ferrireducens]
MSKRNIYLKTIPVHEAVATAIAALDRETLVKPESIAVHEALNRVTSEAVHARCSSPTYHSAAMDGYAVKSDTTFPAREGQPLDLIKNKTCIPVNTGNALPDGMDAVIMIENIVDNGDSVSIEAPAFPWQHVRRIGEDIVATEMLLPRNHTISAFDLGALLSAGIYEIKVHEKIRMTFIPTGDEILPFADRPTPKPGEVIESNSQVFRSLALGLDVEFKATLPVRDREDLLAKAVETALQNSHIVVIGAGSSAGSKDFTSKTIAQLGTLLVHGIAVMPGKPTVLGTAQNKLLVGAPGYPVSAVVCFEDVLTPIISWLSGKPTPEREKVQVRLARRTPSKPGMEEIVRLAVGKVGEGYAGVPLARGAGMITTLTKAQGFTRVPAESEGIELNESVEVELFSGKQTLEAILMHVGSHDNTLDLLGDILMGGDTPIRLVSTHAGSMGGLAALKTDVALFAGVHLFDPESGDFNFPFLEKYLPDVDVTVINLAIRHQGFIVPKGNPLNITGIESLRDGKVSFINRQRGAGTRILFDYHLDNAEILPTFVKGYDREEYTHMAVAANVLTGSADCGLGIYAAAKALDLGFVPLAHERYDLIIPDKYMQDKRIISLINLLKSDEIKKAVSELGGYDTPLTGKIMKPGMGLG